MIAKRVTDLIIAGVLLIVLLPLLVTCAVAVLWADGRPVLFAQTRVGRNGVPYRVLKFRTMRVGSGPLVTASGDARVTALGRILRRLKADELPQLWNVVRGDMSLVGPRPEVPHYVVRHRRWFAAIAGLRPGITDWASLIFRDEEQLLATHAADPEFYERVLLRRKLALARLYARHQSWVLDGSLLAATALVLGGAVRLGYHFAGAQLVHDARAGLGIRN